MLVRATETGYYNLRRYYRGQVFELAEGDKLGAWMRPVTKQAAAQSRSVDDPRRSLDGRSGRANADPEVEEETELDDLDTDEVSDDEDDDADAAPARRKKKKSRRVIS